MVMPKKAFTATVTLDSDAKVKIETSEGEPDDWFIAVRFGEGWIRAGKDGGEYAGSD